LSLLNNFGKDNEYLYVKLDRNKSSFWREESLKMANDQSKILLKLV